MSERAGETRSRLLKTASRLFAERSFKKVTVREICRGARANVAAVNYHFGDKLGLYREVLQAAIDVMRSTTEAARQTGEDQSPEQKLRRYIQVHLCRVLTASRDNLVMRLMHREIADPTPALDDVVEQGLRPRLEYLSGLVAEILGTSPADPRVTRLVVSIQAQLFFYMRMPNPIATRLGWSFTEAQADTLGQHIADFSLAGIYAIRDQEPS